MKTEYQIRKVKNEDLEQVYQVESLCFPEAEAASRKSLEERIQTFPDSFLVAEAEEKIIGFINGAITDSPVIRDEMFEDISLHQPEGRYQSIFGLDVHPAHQKQGIAADLMRHLIVQTREQKKAGLILTCKERLIPFYEQFGYQSMGKSESVHGGAVWYDMILEF